jgi:hypothetical protein
LEEEIMGKDKKIKNYQLLPVSQFNKPVHRNLLRGPANKPYNMNLQQNSKKRFND